MYFVRDSLFKVGDTASFDLHGSENPDVYGPLVSTDWEASDTEEVVTGEITRVWCYYSIGPDCPRSEYFYEINGDSKHRYSEAASDAQDRGLQPSGVFPVDGTKCELGKIVCVSVKTRCPIIDLNKDYTDDMLGKCVFERNGELYVSPMRAANFMGDKEVEWYDAFFTAQVVGIWHDCTNDARVEYELKQPPAYESCAEIKMPTGKQVIFDKALLISDDKEQSYRVLISDGVIFLKEDKTAFINNEAFCKTSEIASVEEIGFPSLASEQYDNENRVFRIPDVRKGAVKKSTAF